MILLCKFIKIEYFNSQKFHIQIQKMSCRISVEYIFEQCELEVIIFHGRKKWKYFFIYVRFQINISKDVNIY